MPIFTSKILQGAPEFGGVSVLFLGPTLGIERQRGANCPANSYVLKKIQYWPSSAIQ